MVNPPSSGTEGARPVALSGRASMGAGYALIPSAGMARAWGRLALWEETRAAPLIRPHGGGVFSHDLLAIAPGGGSDLPEPEAAVATAVYLAEGKAAVIVDGETHRMETGAFAALPADSDWSLRNWGADPAQVHLIRKAYQRAEGLDPPPPAFATEAMTPARHIPGAEGEATAAAFLDATDLRHDLAVSLITMAPGAVLPLVAEGRERGLFVLEGEALCRANGDWLELGPGDCLWLAGSCPFGLQAQGAEPLRALAYAEANRLPALGPDDG